MGGWVARAKGLVQLFKFQDLYKNILKKPVPTKHTRMSHQTDDHGSWKRVTILQDFIVNFKRK